MDLKYDVFKKFVPQEVQGFEEMKGARLNPKTFGSSMGRLNAEGLNRVRETVEQLLDAGQVIAGPSMWRKALE